MKRNDEQEQQLKLREANLNNLATHNYKHTNDIKPLLIPWFSFRLYIVFNQPVKSRRHFYGNEHQVTYNQCLLGKVKNIELNKRKGFDDLVRLVEKTYKGKYQSATIYMRQPGAKEFDVICRRYYLGKIQEHADPVLSDDEGQVLFFYLKEGRLMISETDPEKIDFSAVLNGTKSE